MLIAIVDAEYKVNYFISVGLNFIDFVIDNGWNACLFDFSGSGIS